MSIYSSFLFFSFLAGISLRHVLLNLKALDFKLPGFPSAKVSRQIARGGGGREVVGSSYVSMATREVNMVSTAWYFILSPPVTMETDVSKSILLNTVGSKACFKRRGCDQTDLVRLWAAPSTHRLQRLGCTLGLQLQWVIQSGFFSKKQKRYNQTHKILESQKLVAKY